VPKVLAALASPPSAEALDPDPFSCRSLRHAVYAALLHFGLETTGGIAVDISKGKLSMEETPFNPVLLTKVDDLELSLRSANCLKSNNIVYVGDLVQKTAEELLQTPNFGPRSLSEINMMLAAMDLHLSMEVQGWPPSDPVLAGDGVTSGTGAARLYTRSAINAPCIIGYGSSPSRCGPGRHTASGQTRDIPASDAILLRVMWPSTPAGRQCLACCVRP